MSTSFQPAPRDLHADAVWAATPWLFTVMSVALGVFALPYCLRALQRTGDTVPIILWIGGLLAALVAEPLLGHLDHLWWPRDYPGPTYTSFAAEIPFFIPFAYAFYLGTLGYIGARLMQRGLTVRGVWQLWAALVGSDLAFQFVGVNLKAYVYYGEQPLQLAKLPLVGSFKNGTAYLLVGLIAWALLARLTGRARVWLVLAPLTGYLGGAIITAWPWYIAVNSDMAAGLVSLVGAFTLLTCGLATHPQPSSQEPTRRGGMEPRSRSPTVPPTPPGPSGPTPKRPPPMSNEEIMREVLSMWSEGPDGAMESWRRHGAPNLVWWNYARGGVEGRSWAVAARRRWRSGRWPGSGSSPRRMADQPISSKIRQQAEPTASSCRRSGRANADPG